jgi:hypothetical protein
VRRAVNANPAGTYHHKRTGLKRLTAFIQRLLNCSISLVTEGENFVQIDRRLQDGREALEIIASLFQTAVFFSCIFDMHCFKLDKQFND